MLPVDLYGDAVEYIEPLLDVIEQCDARFAGLRAWRDRRLDDLSVDGQ
nr:hypothetical protein [Amphritea atlantica]